MRLCSGRSRSTLLQSAPWRHHSAGSVAVVGVSGAVVSGGRVVSGGGGSDGGNGGSGGDGGGGGGKWRWLS
jgi:hypothetical protein